MAAGQQARFKPHLLVGLDVHRRATVAIGIQGEGRTAHTVTAPCQHQAKNIHILFAAHGDGAARLRGDQLRDCLHVNTGSPAVGTDTADRLAAGAVPTEHADGQGGLELGLYIDPFIRLQRETGASATGINDALNDQILARTDQDILARTHADNVAIDQQAIATAVTGDIGQLRCIQRAEIATLVVDAVLGFVAGGRAIRAVVSHVVSLIARLHAQVPAESDQSGNQHFLV